MIVAPKIIGAESKKENRAAAVLLRPKNKPEVIVAPALEIPGIIEKACEMPIITASFFVIPLISFLCRAYLSARYKTKPAIDNVPAISRGFLKIVSACFSKSSPKIAPGMVARMRSQSRFFE